MDIHVLIPLVAVLGGSVLAGTLLGLGARLRVNRVVVLMIFCASSWSLFEFMAAVVHDARAATLWLRGTLVFSFGLGPLCVLTLRELRTELRDRLWRMAVWGAAVGFALAMLALLTPLFIRTVTPMSSGGWMPQFGSLAPLLFALQMVLPIYGMVSVLVVVRTTNRALSPLLAVAIGIPIVTVLSTDVLLPYAEIEFPRIGAAAVALIGGGLWLYSRRAIAGPLSDSGFARTILANLPDGIALLERDGHIRSANPSLARMVGRDARDLVRRPIDEFLEIERSKFGHDMPERETLLIADEGERIPVTVSCALIRDRQQDAIGQVLVVRDLRSVVGLRRHMIASGRLAAVGELAAGIAHEVNNPIAFMQSNLNLLRRHHEALEQQLAALRSERPDLDSSLDGIGRPIEDSLAGIERVAAIVRDVRGFAHAGSIEHQSCDVNELLESTLRLATLKHEFYAEIERDYGDLPPFQGSGQDLKQVFLSLTRRATEVVGAFGHIRIKTQLRDDHIEVSVEDDGSEVSEAELRYLVHSSFDPTPEQPSSLELGISQQIVEEHGGDLRVERREGGWTCVRVRLPLAHGDPDEDAASDGSRT
jgi:two-component system NtrC family sensor kinase